MMMNYEHFFISTYNVDRCFSACVMQMIVVAVGTVYYTNLEDVFLLLLLTRKEFRKQITK